jgi:hypothetical protein
MSGSSFPAKKSSHRARTPAAVRPMMGMVVGLTAQALVRQAWSEERGRARRTSARSRSRAALAAAVLDDAPVVALNRASVSSASGDNRMSLPPAAAAGNGSPRPVRSQSGLAPVTSPARASNSTGGGRPFS